MTVPNNSSIAAEHRRHDRLLVARFAAGDAAPGQEHEAQDLVRRCSECAALAADISAISRSVAQLPAPPRPRDFRLTREEADRLRGSRFDRWLRSITGSGWATVRPLAAVALSVGLVMSVVGALPNLGAGAAAPADTFYAAVNPPQPSPVLPGNTRTSPEAAQSAGPVLAASSPADNGQGGTWPPSADMVYPTAGATLNSVDVPARTTAPGQNNTQPQATAQPQPSGAKEIVTAPPLTSPGGRDMLLIAGIALTLLALMVLALLYTARRRYEDPLLR